MLLQSVLSDSFALNRFKFYLWVNLRVPYFDIDISSKEYSPMVVKACRGVEARLGRCILDDLDAVEFKAVPEHYHAVNTD